MPCCRLRRLVCSLALPDAAGLRGRAYRTAGSLVLLSGGRERRLAAAVALRASGGCALGDRGSVGHRVVGGGRATGALLEPGGSVAVGRWSGQFAQSEILFRR